jgi:hypothetical protein
MTEKAGEEQEERRRGRAALLLLPALLLVALCCAWTLFASVPAGEAQAFIAAPLHSSALADYSQDGLLTGMRSLSISIIESVIRDHDPEADDADRRATEVIESMDDPVPTVTPRPGEPSQTPSLTPSLTSTFAPGFTSTFTLTPTATDTATPGPSPTPTSTATQTQTATPGPSPTPCKVRPIVYMEIPPDGTFYGFGDSILGHAHAYDPDDVNPIGCSPTPEVDGAGIVEVEFRVKKFGATVYTQIDTASIYCAFGGDWPCPTVSISGGVWPNSAPIEEGSHELWVRAKDNEGQWSLWDYVNITISLATPTPTPSNTPGPSPTASITPTASNTPIPPSATPLPSSTPTPIPSASPIPSATLPATATPDVCASITLTVFNWSGSQVWWTLTNGSGATIVLTRFDLTWTAGEDLSKAETDGADFWNGDTSSPANISSGWTGNPDKRTWNPSDSRQLRFAFEDIVTSSGYWLDVTFDNGCVTSATVP